MWNTLCRSDNRAGSSDELLSFGKERQKVKIWVLALVPQEEAFDLLFVIKMRQMTKLRRWPSSTARFYGLGMNWNKNELSPARDEKKMNSFTITYFQA
jgi:hypothetical protein